MVAVAVGGAAIVGAGASTIASNKASKTAKKTAAANNALEEKIYGENKAALAPYQPNGVAATSAIGALLGLPNASGDAVTAQRGAFDRFRSSTGYDFRVGEGLKNATAALGNRGGLESGAAKKGLVAYSQNVASDEFGRYYAALTGQQGVGLSAASAQAGVSQNFAGAVSANNNNAASISANATLSNAASISGALQTGLSAYGLSQGMRSSYGGGSALGGFR